MSSPIAARLQKKIFINHPVLRGIVMAPCIGMVVIIIVDPVLQGMLIVKGEEEKKKQEKHQLLGVLTTAAICSGLLPIVLPMATIVLCIALVLIARVIP